MHQFPRAVITVHASRERRFVPYAQDLNQTVKQMVAYWHISKTECDFSKMLSKS
jgi:hypothetical protein